MGEAANCFMTHVLPILEKVGEEPWRTIMGLFGALIVAYITVQLAIRRYKTEKLWERRLGIYSDLIEGLTEMQRLDEIWYYMAFEDGSRSEEYVTELHSRMKSARSRFDSAAALAQMLLSDEANAILKTFTKERESNSQDFLSGNMRESDSHMQDIENDQKTIAALIAVAKRENRSHL